MNAGAIGENGTRLHVVAASGSTITSGPLSTAVALAAQMYASRDKEFARSVVAAGILARASGGFGPPPHLTP